MRDVLYLLVIAGLLVLSCSEDPVGVEGASGDADTAPSVQRTVLKGELSGSSTFSAPAPDSLFDLGDLPSYQCFASSAPDPTSWREVSPCDIRTLDDGQRILHGSIRHGLDIYRVVVVH